MGAIPPVLFSRNHRVDRVEIVDVYDAETLWKIHDCESSWPTDVNPLA